MTSTKFPSVLQMQTIYLPPGGKVINVPGVGQTIYLPPNAAGISRHSCQMASARCLDPIRLALQA